MCINVESLVAISLRNTLLQHNEKESTSTLHKYITCEDGTSEAQGGRVGGVVAVVRERSN